MDEEMDEVLYDVEVNSKCTAVVTELCHLYEDHKLDTYVPLTSYHNLLARGNYKKVKQVLSLLPSQEIKRFVLNTVVDYKDTNGKLPVMGNILPLALAAYSGNQHLVRLLLDEGTLLPTMDKTGNIIHYLVTLSEVSSNKAEQHFKMLMSTVSVREANDLLHSKNKDGLTPLDLALTLRSLGMIHVIVHTPEVYRFSQEQIGVKVRVMYKLPLKNCAPLQKCSILDAVANAGEQDLDDLEALNLLSQEPFQTLVSARKRPYTYGMIKMLLWHSLIAAILLVQIVTVLSGNKPIRGMSYAGLGFVAINVICEALALYFQRKNIVLFFRQWRAKNIPVVVVLPARFLFHTFLLFYLNACVEELNNVSTEQHLSSLAHAVFYLILSLIFYFQYFHKIAAFILICTAMIKDVILFLILGSVIFLAYASCFWILYYPLADLHGSNHTSTTSDSKSFGSFVNSCYEMFLLSLAVIPPASLYFTGSHSPNLATGLYVGCLFIWSIVLLNLLIALFNDRLAHVNTHETTITQLHELCMILFVESFIRANGFLFQPLEFLKSFKTRNISDRDITIEAIENVA